MLLVQHVPSSAVCFSEFDCHYFLEEIVLTIACRIL